MDESCGDGVVEPGVYCFRSVGLPPTELTHNIASAATLDLDDDGRDELIVPYGGKGLVVGFGGDRFSIRQVSETGSPDYYYAVRWDWDRDGREDLVIPTQYNQGDTILLRNLGGTLGPYELHQVGYEYDTNGRSIPLDADGDGVLEFFVAVEYPLDQRGGHLRRFDGRQWVDQGPIVQLAGCGAIDDYVRTDLNGDGHLDLVVFDAPTGCKPYPVEYDPEFHRLSAFLVHPKTGQLTPTGLFTFGGMSARGAWADDFDGDGFVDLAVQRQDALELYILTGNGDGTFNEPMLIELLGVDEQWRLNTRARADFDGDGDTEWLGFDFDGVRGWILEDLLGNQPVERLPPGLPTALVVGDFNGDGIADFVDHGIESLGNKYVVLSNP